MVEITVRNPLLPAAVKAGAPAAESCWTRPPSPAGDPEKSKNPGVLDVGITAPGARGTDPTISTTERR